MKPRSSRFIPTEFQQSRNVEGVILGFKAKDAENSPILYCYNILCVRNLNTFGKISDALCFAIFSPSLSCYKGYTNISGLIRNLFQWGR